MENELITTIQSIRGYLFVLMLIAIVWVVLRIIESILKIKTEYQKVEQKNFSLTMDRYFDAGNYDKVIGRCKYKLERYPNNLDANWYLAKAYYFKEEHELSRKYFEYTLYLAPSWENSVEPFLEKLDANSSAE